MKKLFGKTKEERVERMATLKQAYADKVEAIEHERLVEEPKRKAE
jgi:hypothetical protein